MKLRAVTVESRKVVASNYSHQEFLDEARHQFPNPSPFMEQFLKRYEALATADVFDPADHILDCPQCGAQLTLEEIE